MLANYLGQNQHSSVPTDDVDRTLNATRNSVSYIMQEGEAADYPDTLDDLAREDLQRERRLTVDTAEFAESRNEDLASGNQSMLAPISERDSSAFDRSALIMEAHEDMARSQAKTNFILSSMTKKSALPFKNESLNHSRYSQKQLSYHESGSETSMRQSQRG